MSRRRRGPVNPTTFVTTLSSRGSNALHSNHVVSICRTILFTLSDASSTPTPTQFLDIHDHRSSDFYTDPLVKVYVKNVGGKSGPQIYNPSGVAASLVMGVSQLT